MAYPLPFPLLVFLVIALLFIWNECYGITAVLAGLLLLNRNFAYTHILLGNIPTYIMEYSMLLWLISRLLRNPKAIQETWRNTPSLFRWCWSLYVSIGVIGVARGIFRYPTVSVVRDAALWYYSLVIWLLASSDYSEEETNHALRILCGAVILRGIISLVMRLGVSNSLPPLWRGQSAAESMVMSFALIFLLAFGQLRLTIPRVATGVIFCATIVIEMVRSAWTGLIAGLFALLVSVYKSLGFLRFVQRLLITTTLLILGTSAFITLTTKAVSFRDAKAAAQHSKPSTPIASPPSTVPAPAPIVSDPGNPVATYRPVMSETKHSDPSTMSQQLNREFFSIFKGRASNNAMTRFWMWRDAVSEVLSIGLFSGSLSKEEQAKYHLPKSALQETTPIIHIPIGAEGFPQREIALQVEGPVNSAERWVKRLFGIASGKSFLPPEVIWILNSPFRYEPHNSFVDIFYRSGVLGFAAFTGLLIAVGVMIRRLHIRITSAPETLWISALSACLAYSLMHALTDNVLENPFKGIWFWLFIGMICRLYSKDKVVR